MQQRRLDNAVPVQNKEGKEKVQLHGWYIAIGWEGVFAASLWWYHLIMQLPSMVCEEADYSEKSYSKYLDILNQKISLGKRF